MLIFIEGLFFFSLFLVLFGLASFICWVVEKTKIGKKLMNKLYKHFTEN